MTLLFNLNAGTEMADRLQDILGAGRTLNAKFYLAYEGLLTAAALYMALTFLIVLSFRGLERRYLAHLVR